VKVLLDTHALLWATLCPDSLSKKAARIVRDERNIVLVSAASAWEIAAKVRLGKLPGAERLEREFLEVMEHAGYTLRSIHSEDALRAGRLPNDHRDPFDRMIAAQALADDIPVISADANLETLGARRIW
jgi:PIN domain nuclease of toxin-antitoxin system